MREIKFRVWNPHRKKMERLNLYNIEELDYIKLQYTGLKDANGKMIFEGDIVSYNYKNYEVFDRLGCWFACGVVGYENEHYEVIGNIYENPELLEEKK